MFKLFKKSSPVGDLVGVYMTREDAETLLELNNNLEKDGYFTKTIMLDLAVAIKDHLEAEREKVKE